jgi:hypothetical protein
MYQYHGQPLALQYSLVAERLRLIGRDTDCNARGGNSIGVVTFAKEFTWEYVRTPDDRTAEAAAQDGWLPVGLQ